MTKPDMRAVLDALGIDYRDRSGWAKTRCFNPDHEDRVASATVNLDEGRFTCFGCSASGDVYDLIMLREGGDFAAARRRGEEIAGGSGQPVRATPFSGRRVPSGSGYKPKFKRAVPAWRRP